MDKEKNLHGGHRNRLRSKFSTGGLDTFAEHEVLEMLLFDCIPMRNTNELAHELIKHYGSLWQVFEAHPDELKKFKGMTAAAACSISQYMPVQKYIEVNRLKNTVRLANIGQAKYYFKTLLSRARREEFYLLCLNAKSEILFRLKLREGSVNRVNVDVREVAEAVCRHNATAIAIGHSHPSGDPVPSMSDDDFTRNLYIAMNLMSVQFLDHLIVSGDKIYSYWEQDRMKEFNKDYSLATKIPQSNISDMLAQNKFLKNFYEKREEEEYEYKTI